mmetsp:Transcript_21117/g.29296  ORF Transcript_21117/g.29296 Transcript_21117/m.29296 type:complete len:162 (+) Transcript_21117:279-764(+)
MALKTVTSFQWEKILSKVNNPEINRSLNHLRATANEVTANSVKYVKPTEPIPFDYYKGKLKFTSSAVEALEAAYKAKSLPTYHASLPAFTAKKRELTLTVVDNIVNAAKADIVDVTNQLQELDKARISKNTTVGEIFQRFPSMARETERKLKNHEYALDSA